MTKIANWTSVCDTDLDNCACEDLNDNGVIETARDTDGDGIVSLAELDAVDSLPDGDECILWTTENTYGSDGKMWGPRSVSIGPDGHVWVGDRSYVQTRLDPATGAVIEEIQMDLTGTGTYGSVVDSNGVLWYAAWAHSGCVQSLDINQLPAVKGAVVCQPWDDKTSYGIAIDGQDRIWLATYCNSGYMASRYDPATDNWTKILDDGSAGCTRGITIDSQSRVWVSHWGGGAVRLSRFSANFPDGDPDAGYGHTPSDLVDVYTDATQCNGILGVGIGNGPGGTRQVWVPCYYTGKTMVVDTENTNAISYKPIGSYPYTYSDFTGNLFRTFTAPRGSYRESFPGCEPGKTLTQWDKLSWTASTPSGTAVSFRVRTAATFSGLSSATWSSPYTQTPMDSDTPVDLSGLPANAYMEIEVVLTSSENGNVPLLQGVDLTRYCVD